MRVSRRQAADKKKMEKMASNAIDFHETRSDTGGGISLEIRQLFRRIHITFLS
jgi:hypothetical protein